MAGIGTSLQSYALSLLRIVVGFTISLHGLQKLFGLFGGMGGSGAKAAILTRLWTAGCLEAFGGFLRKKGKSVLAEEAARGRLVVVVRPHSRGHIDAAAARPNSRAELVVLIASQPLVDELREARQIALRFRHRECAGHSADQHERKAPKGYLRIQGIAYIQRERHKVGDD